MRWSAPTPSSISVAPDKAALLTGSFLVEQLILDVSHVENLWMRREVYSDARLHNLQLYRKLPSD